MAITLQQIDTTIQNALRNAANSPLTPTRRVDAYNRVIDFLQSKANWNCTIRRAYFDYLIGEAEYSLSNNLGITDFKQFKDLKFVNDNNNLHTQEFEEINSQDFSVWEGQGALNNVLNFEERDGDNIMRVLSNLGTSVETIDSMDDLTTGRTWSSDTSGSDATTLTSDTNRSKSGNSVNFNIDVSQSANDYATIYTSTVFSSVIDKSEIENLGHFRFWLGLHSMSAANLALISSVTFVWGSDASATPSTKANYWSKTVTAPATGGSFVASWNRMSFDWATATKTGSPDASSLRYFEIKVTYTSGMTDTNNIRIDEIEAFDPSEMELVYFSTSFVNNSGTWQTHFSTDTVDLTEELLLPERHFDLFINLALMRLFPQKQKTNTDYNRAEKDAREQLALAISHDGYAISREKYEFAVNGNSSGRDDLSTNNQW